MKKYLLLLITLLFVALLPSCVDDGTRILPDLEGKSRSEIAEIMEKADIRYVFKFSDQIITSDDELDKFTNYNGTYQAGDVISASYQIYVYTTVLPLTFDNTREVSLDTDYVGKSFIEDGIGIVTLVSAVDGDTARFRDSVTGEEFRLRFLGIDTPESTIDKDPWGKAASNYTKSRLQNAQVIVLEAEGARTETYGRYLGFVWVDGVLLNLELINQAYTNSTLSDSKYESYFSAASIAASKTGRRFFGETDPNYDYVKKNFK